jgi:CHASE3 domain sensor protein
MGSRSTPFRLRVLLYALIALTVVSGLIAGLAASNRQSATTAAQQRAEPLLVAAQTINTSLSDANSTAAASFLRGRLEPTALHARYTTDVDRAAAALATAAQEAGIDPAVKASLSTLSTDLPAYTGLVETALFNERQAFYPLAAAYLSEANNLMRTRILPAATHLYSTEGTTLSGDEQHAVSPALVVLGAFAIGALFVLLLWSQRWLSRHFRRTLNLALVGATVAVAVLGLWFGISLSAQNKGVSTATSEGSHPIDVYTQARILALEMRADDELTLLTQDAVPSYQQDYASVSNQLNALMRTATNSTGTGQRQQLSRARAALRTFGSVHQQIRHLDQSGHLDQAVTLASGQGNGDLPAVSSNVDSVFAQGIDSSQQNFDHAISSASSDLAGVLVAIAVLAILAALLVLFGLQPRLSEYR